MRKKHKMLILLICISSCMLFGCEQMERDGKREKEVRQKQEEQIEKERTENVQSATENSLVWVVDNANLAGRLEEPLNKLLKEKGVSYTVSIEGGAAEDYERQEHYVEMLKEMKNTGKNADVIYMPMSYVEGNDYVSAVREGLLSPLDLEEKENYLTEILGEFALESVKVDGIPYGLRGLPKYHNFGLGFSKYYIEKQAISMDALSGNLLENQDLYRKIAEDEELETPLVYWTLTEERLGYEFLYPSCVAGFSYDQGGEIVNVFEQKDVKEYLEALKGFRDEGLISFVNIDGFDVVSIENSYFSICSYGINWEPYSYQVCDFLDKDGNQIVTDVLFVPGEANEGSLGIIPRGQITGIASWSERPDLAYEFLELLYTDADVANLVKFGVEGEDYVLENGRVTKQLSSELYPAAYEGYINDMLTYPMEQEPDEKEKGWEMYFQKKGIHPLTGFQFDPEPVQKEIENTNRLIKSSLVMMDSYTPEFRKLMSVNVENVEEALTDLNQKLEEAGISKIIEEANRQVREWKVAKEE